MELKKDKQRWYQIEWNKALQDLISIEKKNSDILALQNFEMRASKLPHNMPKKIIKLFINFEQAKYMKNKSSINDKKYQDKIYDIDFKKMFKGLKKHSYWSV